MKYDIIFAGVGGQGVLSMAAIIGMAAIEQGLRAKQSEVHGMAQRGGSVQAHLRLADHGIESDLIPRGGADLILSMEPVESLRYLDYLAPDGGLVTTATPFVNMPQYPDVNEILDRIRRLPNSTVVQAESLAEQAGNPLCTNSVMVGAAAHLLPMPPAALEAAIGRIFVRKGAATVAMNLAAFRAGRAAAETGAAAGR
jgi:indolepyruvate ferredoxin oxidoreductase beta subunit